MTTVQQKAYLLTEQQRDALLNYLLDRPYREVAAGVEFLKNAPSTILNIEVPEPQGSTPTQGEPQSNGNTQQEVEVQVAPSSQEEFAVLSPV
ncbi:hypothetical protein H6G76_31420 [Nostoc sp. FACHB-152]|uniref:hypothetical protein n=1 Tax=unclassified Nostoc TaxID=2593658 RepID=UPI0016891EAE|nr:MULTISPECIES: hypothetical protein [unclassified Nostoc]MBD2451549.1 hypothetical protein [Nostoc sp. FACHB-152]MBD2466396.1 hypothetical protein [Nostoc sp. FACHB-145]